MNFIDLKAQQKMIIGKIKKRVDSVLEHGKYIMGPEVFELEERLAEYVKTKFCISCFFRDRCPTYAFISKKHWSRRCSYYNTIYLYSNRRVISLIGATPIFVDIYQSTLNIDASRLKKLLE